MISVFCHRIVLKKLKSVRAGSPVRANPTSLSYLNLLKMAIKLKANGHGGFLNGSRDNYLHINNVDPMYKMFLNHLRTAGKSYILDMDDDESGIPVFVKYECDGLSDFLQLDAPINSQHISSVKRGRVKTKKRRIRGKLEAQATNIADLSGFLLSQVENKLVVDSNAGLRSFRNSKSVDLFDSRKNQAGRNLVDESYQEFLSYVKVQDGLMVLEYNSFAIIYEGYEASVSDENVAMEGTFLDGQENMPFERSIPSTHKLANEGTSCSDRQGLVIHENSLTPDVVIYEAGDRSIVPFDSCNLSSFDLKLMTVLSKPYDEHEHEVLWEQANFRKPVLRHKDLRNQSKSFSTMRMGFSYLDHFPDLAKILEHSNPQHSLSLLRGLFYWLENLCHEGAYQPWTAASSENSSVVDVSDLDLVMVPPAE